MQVSIHVCHKAEIRHKNKHVSIDKQEQHKSEKRYAIEIEIQALGEQRPKGIAFFNQPLKLSKLKSKSRSDKWNNRHASKANRVNSDRQKEQSSM